MDGRAQLRILDGIEGLTEAAGAILGVSPWHLLDQERVDRFADATGDHYWIHVDPARAARGPFGGTIAHGFLTLSLLPELRDQVVQVVGFALTVNYGTDHVRFPSPLRVGSEIRATVSLDTVEATDDGALSWTTVTCESRDGLKPHCVATLLTRHYLAGP